MNCEPRKWDEFASPDRHPKWQRVEPGTVIPAGQPIRWEYANGSAYECVEHSGRTVTPDMAPHFIDSSWKPPLVLPTEPTNAIVLLRRSRGGMKRRVTCGGRRSGDFFAGWKVDDVIDVIPLTDEQVARIEGAR